MQLQAQPPLAAPTPASARPSPPTAHLIISIPRTAAVLFRESAVIPGAHPCRQQSVIVEKQQHAPFLCCSRRRPLPVAERGFEAFLTASTPLPSIPRRAFCQPSFAIHPCPPHRTHPCLPHRPFAINSVWGAVLAPQRPPHVQHATCHDIYGLSTPVQAPFTSP